MYDPKKKLWISDCQEALLMEWAMAPEQQDNPRALFLRASDLLAQKDKVVDAVYEMEKSAKLGCPDAMVAMGQMYEYGCGVARHFRYALDWYEKAAKLGDTRAITYLSKLKKQRRRRQIVIFGSIIIGLGAIVMVIMVTGWLGSEGHFKVTVADHTTLQDTTTFASYEEATAKLVERYDDEAVKSGQKPTNRLIVGYDGDELDLTAFPATHVITREGGIVIIQFDNEADAAACFDALSQLEAVRFVEWDEYDNMPSTYTMAYPSTYTGEDYLSWGIAPMQMDELAAYIQQENLNREVTVAVIDSGIEPPSEMQDRIQAGTDYVDGGDGLIDIGGHGTHVSGTILDATRGLDVTVFPVRVFDGITGCSTLTTCQAIEFAMTKQPDVINMSLGGTKNTYSSYEEELILQAVDQGIVVVVAAGNGDENGIPMDTATVTPAYIDACIVVGAIDDQGQIASFSNYGDSVDVVAPGVYVESYGINGEQYATMSGTSMATPHVSALASMLCMIYPEATPVQIEKYIKYYCQNLGDERSYGEGLPLGGMFVEN